MEIRLQIYCLFSFIRCICMCAVWCFERVQCFCANLRIHKCSTLTHLSRWLHLHAPSLTDYVYMWTFTPPCCELLVLPWPPPLAPCVLFLCVICLRLFCPGVLAFLKIGKWMPGCLIQFSIVIGVRAREGEPENDAWPAALCY